MIGSRDPLFKILGPPSIPLKSNKKKSGVDQPTIRYALHIRGKMAKHIAGVRISNSVWDRVTYGLTN